MNILLNLILYFNFFNLKNIIFAENPINNFVNQNIIYLTIKGTGRKRIVSEDRFAKFPDLIYINDEKYQFDVDDDEKIYIEKVDEYGDKLENENIVSKIKLVWNNKLTNCDYLFYSIDSLIEIDFSEFDCSEVTSMSSMLYNCYNLKNVTFGQINTSSLVDMSFMFGECEELKEIDLSNFDTSNVKTMDSIFYNCKSIISLNLSNLDTSKLQTLERAFYRCI